MAEYFAHVLARMIVSYLTLLVISLAILAGYWLIADYDSMVAFINEVRGNAFAEFVVWMPLIFAWFKPDKKGNANAYYHRQANFWAMYDTTGGRW
ncbi:MAG: hypothetical protein AB7S49_13150 [Arcobacter sp.]|jgi:nitrate/nitrite transporter NarK|uniref:hypothetical protein n=1 Tax=Arcobacter sp. TaxID=1872629 RepID=UPI003D05C551